MVNALGGTGYAVECDVSIRENVEELALRAGIEFDGPTTVLINNAGVGIGGKPVGDIGFEDWNWALGINLWGVIHGCEVFTPGLRAAGEGGIINVASEYLGDRDASIVERRIAAIPDRLDTIWAESADTDRDPASVADAMARKLIGRG